MNLMAVTLTYNGTTLHMTLTDTVTKKAFDQSWTVNIPQVIGSSMAYVGFTAACGAEIAVIRLASWTYGSPNAVNFGGGFPPAAAIQANGSGQIANHTLRLDHGNANEVSSAFATTPVNVSAFTTTFTFSTQAAQAEGIMFVIQNAPTGIHALGSGAASLGYAGIPNSVGIKFSLYNNGELDSSTDLYINGRSPPRRPRFRCGRIWRIGEQYRNRECRNLRSGDESVDGCSLEHGLQAMGYPTVTSLADGRILVTAGWQTTAHSNAGISEIYDPATNAWTKLTNANNPFETYPFLYQLGDGRILHIGGSEYATDTDVLDIGTQAWSVIDSRVVDGGSATMYLPGQFMKAGTAADSQNVGRRTIPLLCSICLDAPAWQQTPSMAYPRSFFNLIMLPDGTALATGGETDQNGGNIANAVYTAELWSPQTKTWRTMAAMHTPREYHGTALLLPDGRVLESGMGADFGNVPDEKSAEFVLTAVSLSRSTANDYSGSRRNSIRRQLFRGNSGRGQHLICRSDSNWRRNYFFDQNERFIPLSFQQAGGGLTLTAPSSANVAPPGYYMLFIVNSNGVPSIAPFVRLSN